MAITTWEKAKLILNLPDAMEDKVAALIPMIEEHYELIRGRPFEQDEDENNVYPSGAEMTAIEMLRYRLGVTPGVSSESLGDHSVVYESGFATKIYGYPVSVVGDIERYVKWR